MKNIFILLVFLSTITLAHPGGQDDNGGHVNRSTGIYHCHQDDCVLPGTTNSIKITSFNIQFLGNPKSRDNSALASLVADSDIVLVQELVAPPYQGTYPDGTTYNTDPEAQDFSMKWKIEVLPMYYRKKTLGQETIYIKHLLQQNGGLLFIKTKKYQSLRI